MMKIIIGSDHAGFDVKERVKRYLNRKNISFEDIGTYSKESVDYPDYAFRVAKRIAKNRNFKGILVCGTGTGMVMAANRVKGVRAVAAYDSYTAKMSRQDNNANILCLRGRGFPWERIRKIINVWLNTDFSNASRHRRRIKKLDKK